MISGEKGCAGCKYRMTEDTGYSNWTVTGTEHTCLLGLNPDMPLNDEDASYDAVDKALLFGETCARRVVGDGPNFDVDGDTTPEEACKGDAELLALVRKVRNGEGL